MCIVSSLAQLDHTWVQPHPTCGLKGVLQLQDPKPKEAQLRTFCILKFILEPHPEILRATAKSSFPVVLRNFVIILRNLVIGTFSSFYNFKSARLISKTIFQNLFAFSK